MRIETPDQPAMEIFKAASIRVTYDRQCDTLVELV